MPFLPIRHFAVDPQSQVRKLQLQILGEVGDRLMFAEAVVGAGMFAEMFAEGDPAAHADQHPRIGAGFGERRFRDGLSGEREFARPAELQLAGGILADQSEQPVQIVDGVFDAVQDRDGGGVGRRRRRLEAQLRLAVDVEQHRRRFAFEFGEQAVELFVGDLDRKSVV